MFTQDIESDFGQVLTIGNASIIILTDINSAVCNVYKCFGIRNVYFQIKAETKHHNLAGTWALKFCGSGMSFLSCKGLNWEN